MADFFDIGKQNDLNLLHSSVRTNSELENVVNKIEWEIIEAFKQRDMQGIGTYQAFFEYESGRNPNEDIEVRLVGYNKETPGESDEGLKEALRRTIAGVVEWVLMGYNDTRTVQSERLGRWSATYKGQVPSYRDFPAGWDNKLKNYDARFVAFGI